MLMCRGGSSKQAFLSCVVRVCVEVCRRQSTGFLGGDKLPTLIVYCACRYIRLNIRSGWAKLMIKRAKQSWEQWKQQQPSLADEPPPTPFPEERVLWRRTLLWSLGFLSGRAVSRRRRRRRWPSVALERLINVRIATGLSSSTKKTYLCIYLFNHSFIYLISFCSYFLARWFILPDCPLIRWLSDTGPSTVTVSQLVNWSFPSGLKNVEMVVNIRVRGVFYFELNKIFRGNSFFVIVSTVNVIVLFN